MTMATLSGVGGLGLVLVEFEYEYTGRDGSRVSIKPNERYMLLAKTNDHWWQVRRNERSKPFYIPAKYVKELPNAFPSPLDFTARASPPSPELKQAPPLDLAEEKRAGDEVTIRLRSSGGYRKSENRMSTFGVPLDIHDPPTGFKRGGHTEPSFPMLSGMGGGGGGTQELSSSSSSSSSSQKKRLSLNPSSLFGGSRGSSVAPTNAVPSGLSLEDLSQKPRVPSFSPADPVQRPIQGKPVDLPIIKALTNESPLREESPEPASPLEPDSESASSTEPDRSPDSENIYESILDLNLNGSHVTEAAPALIPAPALPESSSTHTCHVSPVPQHTKVSAMYTVTALGMTVCTA